MNTYNFVSKNTMYVAPRNFSAEGLQLTSHTQPREMVTLRQYEKISKKYVVK